MALFESGRVSGKGVRIIVFGYHTIGYLCLRELLARGEEVVAVVTHRDDPGEEIWFESVAELARPSGIAVFQPRNPNTPRFTDLVRSLRPDLLLSFYYRRLLSRELLAIPRLGGINLHGSLLPKYRGRSPANWALINGETRTGVTLHYMTEEADAGDIIAQQAVAITAEDTALTLFRRLAPAALELLRTTFPLIKAGHAPRTPQDPRQATLYGGRRPEDGKIDWRRPALGLYNLIRAVTAPYPGAFTCYHGRKLYVWRARPISPRPPAATPALFPGETGDGVGKGTRDAGVPPLPGTVLGVQEGGFLVASGGDPLLLTLVQLQGEQPLPGDVFASSHGLAMGTQLGENER